MMNAMPDNTPKIIMLEKQHNGDILTVEVMDMKLDKNESLPPSPGIKSNLHLSQTKTDSDDPSYPIVSGTGAIATCFFFIGLLMFLVGFASHDWLGLEKGVSLSLWNQCHRHFVVDVWTCQEWEDTPGFVRAAQGFCVFGLLLYAMSVIILIAYLIVQFLQRIKAVIIALCSLIFAAGLMTLVALVVLGIKGNEYLTDLQKDDAAVLHLYSIGVDVNGEFYIGWSFTIAVVSAFITLASFTFCLIEFVHVREYS